MTRSSGFRSRVLHGILCLVLSTLPGVSLCQAERPGDVADFVLWEGAPLAWFEQGRIVLREAVDFEVELPASSFVHGKMDARSIASGTLTFSTGFGLELLAERTSIDSKGRAESPSRSIPYGGIWVATTVPRESARPHVVEIIESLAAGPLDDFGRRVPRGGSQDAARFFTFSDSPFFTEEPTWVCYELPGGSFVGRVLSAEPWTAPTGEPALRTSIGSSSAYAPICRAIAGRIGAEAERSTSFPSRLTSERKPRRRLSFTLFRSYESTSEVSVAGSHLALGPEVTSAHVPSDPELDLWLARAAPVAMRFTLDEASAAGHCRWEALGEWIVVIHPPRVDRPRGGVEEDLRRWEESIVELARTDLKNSLVEAVQGIHVLDASDLLSTPQRRSEGFRGGILIENLTEILGDYSAIAMLCGGDRAAYALFPVPAIWAPVRNGEMFCDELRSALPTLEPVSID